jgi:predicted HTH transcriptional regulator
MNANELLALIAQGENQALEFKQTWPRPEQLASEIVAFANSNGGTIVLGVSDHKEIVGIDNEPPREEWVMNIARSDIEPALDVSYQTLPVDGKTLALIHVSKGQDTPYQTGDKYYIRVGSTNRSPTQSEFMRLYQLAGVFHYDAVAVQGKTANDLNQAAIDNYTALATLKNRHITPSTIQGAHRVDSKPQPSDKALRELLVNACVHRNYSIAGSKIRLFLFDDRIECHSPGRLPNTITLNKLRFGVSYASNPVIIKFMDNLRYIDRLGHGFPLLYREAKRLGSELEVDGIGDVLRIVLRLSR